MEPMVVTRLAEGLWQWSTRHPEWREGADWDPVVSSVYLETGSAIVLFDPLVPDGSEGDRFWRALDRDVARLAAPVHVMLTCGWHLRSARLMTGRYGARVWAPETGGKLAGVATDEAIAGEVVPGVVAIDTGMPPSQREVLYWVPAHRALIAGDVLLGGGGRIGVAPPSWYSERPEEQEWYRDGLAGVLAAAADRGPEMLLPAHGAPVVAGATSALRGAIAATPG